MPFPGVGTADAEKCEELRDLLDLVSGSFIRPCLSIVFKRKLLEHFDVVSKIPGSSKRARSSRDCDGAGIPERAGMPEDAFELESPSVGVMAAFPRRSHSLNWPGGSTGEFALRHATLFKA